MIADPNLRGIALMVMAMGAFALADTFVKVSASTLSPAQVLFFLIGGALVLFGGIAVAQGESLMDRRALSPVLWLRYVAEVAGMVGMVTALALVPISTVGAITQAAPLLAVVGAVVFLQEQIGWRRWVSIACGFIGVLLIVQPGAIAFDVSVLWAVLALVALSVRDLTTRLVPADMPSISLATYTMVAAAPFAVGWVVLRGEALIPAHANWWVIVPMVVLGALGYMLLIASLRSAEVSVVMPYRYTRIVFLIGLGIAVFGERPDRWMLAGAALIVVSGTYMMWREQRVKQAQLTSSDTGAAP